MDTEKRFTFLAQGLPAETFTVVGFSGTEGISRPYEFVINLASSRDDLGLKQIAEGLCTFTMLRKEGDLPLHGIVTRFEQLNAVKGLVFYRAVLGPRLCGLGLSRHNRVFLDQSAPEFLAELLDSSGILSSMDYEFRLTGNYPKREFVCQYRETDLNFFSRWLEREGMYYYFEQLDSGDKLVITDSAISQQHLPDQPTLEFRQVQGMNFSSKEEFVHSFVCEESIAPKSVLVKDYNYRLPTLDIQGTAEVRDGSMGEVQLYGDNVKTTEEAKRQATFVAEEATSQMKRYKGRSTSPFLRSGHTFTLDKHFRTGANQEHLTLSVQHEGQQTGYLITVFGRALASQEAKNYYRNTFVAMPASVQYRHPRQTEKPRFYGLISARVDASGSGQYAELDDKGRYKIRLPFDLSGRPEGKASSWVRMAQPYGGANHGMHFPLLKGSEVLLAFIDGDVDRPVIAHAAPNFEQQSIVASSNAPANAIRSVSGNQLVMGDKSGQEFIGMFSPFHKSGIAVGSMKEGGGGSISISTEGDFDSYSAGAKNEVTFGASNGFTCGVTNEVFVGLKNELVAAISYSASLASKVEYVKGSAISLGDEGSNLKNEVDSTGLDKVTLAGGVAAPLKGMITKAKLALAAGMTGTAMAGAGIVGLSAPYDDGFLKNASLEWKDFSYTLGLSSTVVGALMSACSAGVVEKLVTQFENASELAKTSTIVLDKKGISCKVNCDVSSTAKFLVEVYEMGGKIDDLKSSMEIASDGESITLTNQKKALFAMQSGKSISLKQEAAPGNSREIVVDSRQISLTNKTKAEILVGSNSAVMKSLQPQGGQVLATTGKARMSCGASSVEATPTGIKLDFSTRLLQAGPLTINPAGIIQMG